VTRFKPGQGDHLLELGAVALDPAQNRERFLLGAVAHIEHGPTQHGDPQDLLGALGWRRRRDENEFVFQSYCTANAALVPQPIAKTAASGGGSAAEAR
jgi:hypothetical protein